MKTKKFKMNTKKSLIVYAIFTVFLLIFGFIYKEPIAFVGAVLLVVSGFSFHWISKAHKKPHKK